MNLLKVDGIMIYYPVFGQRPSFHGGSHDDYLRDTVSPYKAEGSVDVVEWKGIGITWYVGIVVDSSLHAVCQVKKLYIPNSSYM